MEGDRKTRSMMMGRVPVVTKRVSVVSNDIKVPGVPLYGPHGEYNLPASRYSCEDVSLPTCKQWDRYVEFVLRAKPHSSSEQHALASVIFEAKKVSLCPAR